MKRLLLKLLPVILALLTAACSDSGPWYAEVTEWVRGLPMDNICELTAPTWAVSAEYGKHSWHKTAPGQFAACFDKHKKIGQSPALPMLPKKRADLLLYHDSTAEQDPLYPTALHLPKGTRIELLSVWLEKMTPPDSKPSYAVCAELRPAQSAGTFWVILAWKEAPSTLALLANPTTGKPLTLSLEDALLYTTKKHFTAK